MLKTDYKIISSKKYAGKIFMLCVEIGITQVEYSRTGCKRLHRIKIKKDPDK